jgi:hypothetical protein
VCVSIICCVLFMNLMLAFLVVVVGVFGLWLD